MLLDRRRSLVTNVLVLCYRHAFADRTQQCGYSDVIVVMMNHSYTTYSRRRKGKLSRKSVLEVLPGSDVRLNRMASHRVVRQELRYKSVSLIVQ